MENPVGLRFRPTDEEIVVDYLRPKNSDRDTSHVDRVISTVTIRSFDPWELPCQSRIKLKDESWCFFSPKENKYGRGDQQIRKTKSGFWKITGKPKDIMRNRQKIGVKKILMFYYSKELGGSKSDWVMHEYHAFSPTQMMMTYTICKVMFNGDVRESSSSSSSSHASGIEQSRPSVIPLFVNNSEGSSFHSEELQNPSRFGDVQQEAQIEDAIPIEEWETWLNDDDAGEQRSIMFMQDNRNDYRPPKSLTGVFSDDSSDDNDSDLLSATTKSIETSSTCDSFASSNHCVDPIKGLQESPNSTIKLGSLTQEVSQAPRTSIDTSENKNNPYDDAQGIKIGVYKLGQETVKKTSAGFFHRMIQKFVKKIRVHLCSSISRT
ncbi:NAC domain [Arabidopsis suecica]|uniref:NAC domain n=1 Tax=Arabidopsis suecica TaxID=45249 RepID=A0A8T2CCR9_ARASU|nr:NAC domain [Arabidopsis suecica]